jgi:hypothetical protein
MKTIQKMLATIGIGAAFCLGATFPAASAFADVITLKNGEVLDGTVERDEADFIVIKITKNGKVETRIISKDDIKKREAAKPAATPATKPTTPAAPSTPAAPAKPAEKNGQEAKPAPTGEKTASAPSGEAKDPKASTKPSDRALTGRAMRIAFLNFGNPLRDQGAGGDMVGVHVSAKAFRDVLPILEKEKVDIVVIRINSGGGYTLEMERLSSLFQDVYKQKFRTVAWIESAISAAAMSPWVLEEFYMMTNGNIGGCTEFAGSAHRPTEGAALEVRLSQMERFSRLAGRDPKIMRAMQIQEPLSCTIDEFGNVTWFQDLTGEIIVNRAKEVLTFNAPMAVKTKFARGIADTREELASAMGLTEYEFVAEEATKMMDRYMLEAQRIEESMREMIRKYQLAINVAAGLPREERGPEVGRARKHLGEIKKMVDLNPNFQFHFGIEFSPAFFAEQEQILRDLMK